MNHLDVNKIQEDIPFKGADVFPFDVEYIQQSQMHVNTINGANLSSNGSRMMRYIYRSIREDDEEE